MQQDSVIQQLKEEAKKVEQHLSQLGSDEHFTHQEAEQFLSDVEKLHRYLAVYTHVLKTQQISADMKVHLKIMQTVPKDEEPIVIPTPVISERLNVPEPEINFEEKKEDSVSSVNEENIHLKKIEFSINDRFRVINELFFQSQQEFQAALQQLNSIYTLDESLFYLDSLKQIYNWKDDNALVKNLHLLVKKRFLN